MISDYRKVIPEIKFFFWEISSEPCSQCDNEWYYIKYININQKNQWVYQYRCACCDNKVYDSKGE